MWDEINLYGIGKHDWNNKSLNGAAGGAECTRRRIFSSNKITFEFEKFRVHGFKNGQIDKFWNLVFICLCLLHWIGFIKSSCSPFPFHHKPKSQSFNPGIFKYQNMNPSIWIYQKSLIKYSKHKKLQTNTLSVHSLQPNFLVLKRKMPAKKKVKKNILKTNV